MNYKRLFAGMLAGFLLQTAQAAEVRYGVMCYHDVIDEAEAALKAEAEQLQMGGDIRRSYFPQTITVQKLAAHFNWLRNNGYTPVSFKQIEDARAGRGSLPAKPVLLTFDDGYMSFYTKIYPLLKAFDYPAVYALVTSWMETPPEGYIAYGKKKLPRKDFITWAQVREMQKSGLIEIASHTHDLHRSITGNPDGSQFAAIFPEYRNGRYESREAYRQRVHNDLKRSADIIAARTGIRPNVIVWPYGQFNETAREIAAGVGLTNDFTLFDERLNTTQQHSVGRALIDNETGYPLMRAYLDGKTFPPPHHRAMQIDLGALHNPDPAVAARNFDKLIERVYKMGVTTVYLQAVADDDGNGTAEAAYFPNRHLKMKADLFSRAAWQLITRSNVKVYAWMPATAFDLGGRRADPATVAEIYEDLAYNSRFHGMVFQDSSQNRPDVSPAGANGLIAYSDMLKQTALKYSYNGRNEMKTVLSLPEGSHRQPPFAFNLPRFAQAYTYTAVAASPYGANGQPLKRRDAAAGLAGLVGEVKRSGVPLEKTVFAVQAASPLTGQFAEGGELAGWFGMLKKEGARNLAYFPDDYVQNQPPLKAVKPAFSVQPLNF